MRRVRRTLRLATSVRISNVWIFEDEGKRFLVDTGHWSERITLALELWRAGIRKGDLTGILLTHRHSDHAGNAAWLKERFGCPVFCHEKDARVLSGAVPATPLTKRGAPLHQEWLCWFEDKLPARCTVDETYTEGAWRFGFEVTTIPGHTEGSVVLYQGATKTLFSGDSIVAGPPPLRSIEHLYLAVPGFSLDVQRSHANVKRFLKTVPPVQTLCSGHGPAVLDATQEKLRRLAD